MEELTFISEDKPNNLILIKPINLIYGVNGSIKTQILKTLTSKNIVVCGKEKEAIMIWELRTNLSEQLATVKGLLSLLADRASCVTIAIAI